VPDVIEDPVTGERIEFISTAQDAGVLTMRLQVRAGGGLLRPHMHPAQEERIAVVLCVFAFEFTGTPKRLLHAGDELLIPPGVEHIWSNPTDADAVALVELRPPLDSEAVFRLLFRRDAERARKSRPSRECAND